MNKVFIIGGEAYNFKEPSVENISKMGQFACEAIRDKDMDGKTVSQLLSKEQLATAISLLYNGDTLISNHLLYSEKEELESVFEDFYCDFRAQMIPFSNMARGVSRLIAKPKE